MKSRLCKFCNTIKYLFTMSRHKENVFLEKFSLLNSQERNDEVIKWSSSSSSDYEHSSYSEQQCNNNNSLKRPRKRKRKKKLTKNVSNLDVTIIDASKSNNCREKSPILMKQCIQRPISPILTSSKFPPKKTTSPILGVKSVQPKSPILMQKNLSPRHPNKVRKKLAYSKDKIISMNIEDQQDYLLKTPDRDGTGTFIQPTESQSNDLSIDKTINEDSRSSLKSVILSNVKNYFNSHFSSDSASQHISDTQTPEDCSKSDSIEILSCKTQTLTNIPIIKQENSSNSDTSTYFEKNKKLKYKKGGLACRLNTLVKKQNAQISLWQHEKFLAGNCNFVIPKEEHKLFCVKSVECKYGCYLINAVDVNNDYYVIFVNNSYVTNNICTESVLKLYEPYRISSFRDRKIILNVIKFDSFLLEN